jgi:hypothetical protein
MAAVVFENDGVFHNMVVTRVTYGGNASISGERKLVSSLSPHL